MKKLISGLIVAVCIASVPLANAGLITARAVLTGTQEVPANDSTGVGLAEILFDTSSNLLSLSANIGGGIALADITFPAGPLSFGEAGPMHIHQGAADVNGPIVVPFSSASFYRPEDFGVSVLAVGVPYDPGILSALESGELYLNLHTLSLPGGEIRGRLAAVPEPLTLAMLGTGLAALGFARRRRRS
jgi:hypothetical protein